MDEKRCEMQINKDDKSGLEIAFQVVDQANKALLSVNRVCSKAAMLYLQKRKGILYYDFDVPMM